MTMFVGRAAALCFILAAPLFGFAPAAAASRAILPAAPKKQVRAAKRQRLALPTLAPVHRRSKNPPTKRKLKSNRLHISKRVRRKHRRAA